MIKNSTVLFRPGSRLPAAIGVAADTVGIVMCKYMICHPGLGSPERIDVRFEDGRFAWGAPASEFLEAAEATQEAEHRYAA